MVQIGNEIDNGLLWEDGRLDGTQVQWDKFGSLVKSGIEGVKQSIKNNENISIMIHKADGCNNQAARNFFDNIHKINIEFDIIGFSYYPFFHGTFEELKMNLKDISKRYHKDIIIVETAWGWTGENGDGYPHLIKTNKPLKLPFSGKGQILFIKRLVDIIIKINHCKGLFYWAPEFIPINGVGWKNGEGNEWDNMTLFDFQGNALDSLDAFLK
jgi:arabinogalactan endo-1,4-beta-galactosidase